MIDLFAKEHFIAHKLLASENPESPGIVRAYTIMAFTKNKNQLRYELTPEEYEEARISLSTATKIFYSNPKNHPCYGKTPSAETRAKQSAAKQGYIPWNKGISCSEQTKAKIGKANRNPSEKTRQKMSAAQKNRSDLKGANNPKAKSVVRLSDGKIYGCIKEALQDNPEFSPHMFSTDVRKQKHFKFLQ